MTVEVVILAITGIVASLTYIAHHFKKSECWTKEKCCVCKMDKDDSKSDLSDTSEDKKKQLEEKITISSVV